MAAFAREADAYLDELRESYQSYMTEEDDNGVAETSHAVLVVERAACVHLAARTLAYVRSPSNGEPKPEHDRADADAARKYLEGVQGRMAVALVSRDIPALERLCDGADTAMNRLASKTATASEICTRATRAARFENAALDAARRAESDSALVRVLSRTDVDYGVIDPELRLGLARILHVIVVLVAVIGIGFITRRFLHGLKHPASFASVENTQVNQMTLTICLASAGIPLSMLELPTIINSPGPAQRFWDNPKSEDCDRKIGTDFNFPLSSLNAVAVNQPSTKCRPCYRVPVRNASLLTLKVDSFATQCFSHPGGLMDESVRYLHDYISSMLLDENGILRSTILTGAKLTSNEVSKLNGRQLCNVLYFALLPHEASKNERQSGTIAASYNWSNGKWKWTGNGSEFQPPANDPIRGFESSETIQVQLDSSQVSIGVPSYSVLNLRPQNIYGEQRYDIDVSSAASTDRYPIVHRGFWLTSTMRIHVSEKEEVYYRAITYTSWQYAIDFVSYITLIIGSMLFTKLMHSPDGEPESAIQHILRRHRAHFAAKQAQ